MHRRTGSAGRHRTNGQTAGHMAQENSATDPMNDPTDDAVWARAQSPMTDPSERAMYITQLKDRVARSAYTVDASAVAEALLRQPAARRRILPGSAVSRPGARSPQVNGFGRPS